MNVVLTLEEATKLSKAFKVCYQSARLPSDEDKRVRCEYRNLIRKIEEVETLLLAERKVWLENILKQHEEKK